MYCKKCGKEIAEDVEYCPRCRAGIHVSELELASTGERFLSFIIDSVLVGFVIGAVL